MNRDNLLNLTNQIRSTFTDTTLCRQAFVFNIGNSTNFPAAPTVNRSYALNRVTAFGRNLVLTNAAIPTTTDVSTPATSAATGLRLQLALSSASATPGFTNWDATLVVPLVVTNQSAMRDLTVTFLITTNNSTPTVIASCNAMASGTTEQSVCENIMGGIYNIGQTPSCRLQQTLVSGLKYRGQLSAIPGGTFLAVESTAGSRGIAAFGAGARIGLYPTEADFASSPANGVGLSIPANNQLQIDASQGILSDSYLHITRAAAGPSYALKLTNSTTSTDVFNLERDGRISLNTTQNAGWNNIGASSAVGDILQVYDSVGALRAAVNQTGDFGIGPGAGASKLDVRADANGPVISWGVAGGVQGTLSANPGVVSLSNAAGNNMDLVSAGNLNLTTSGVFNLTATGLLNLTTSTDLRISANAGTNTVNFTNTDTNFNLNVNAPTFNNVSDRRLKTDIEEIGSEVDRLTQLKGISYSFKNDGNKVRHFGFIAQELQEIYPNLVRTGSNGFLTVNYVEVIPLLVEALKESKKSNLILERRIGEMEKSLKKIELQLEKTLN